MTEATREQQTAALEKEWAQNPRWKGIKRTYSAGSGPIPFRGRRFVVRGSLGSCQLLG